MALTRRSEFVTTKTQFATRTLYTVKPRDAVVCPTNSHLETPALVRSRHCLRTWRASVTTRTAELAHPMSSVTP